MSKENHTLHLSHIETLRDIGAFFHHVGYREDSVLEQLQLDTLSSHRQRRQKLPLLLQRTRAGTALDVLIRLFFLRHPVSTDASWQAVSPMDLREWQEVGLLDIDGDQVTARVELYPFQDIILAADWPSQQEPNDVMSVSASSRLLAQLTIRRPSSHTLDLGAGAGIQALLASHHSERVTAIDCNPRAAMFAQFNAQLNGCENITFETGNLFEPVDSQTFDLIVSCPPFVISPDVAHIHTHNTMPADELCRTIVKTAPRFLNDGGYCQVIGNWAQIDGQDWRERLAELCRDIECDALLTYSHAEDAATYAFERIQEMSDDMTQFKHWLRYFEKQRIDAVGFGLVTLRRKRGSANWFHAERIRPNQNGDVIERQFAVRDSLQKLGDDRDLLNTRLRVSAALRLHEQSALTSDDWSVNERQLHDNESGASIKVGPEVLAFLKYCDGKRTVLQCFRAAAPVKGKNVSPPAVFLKVVRRLVEEGFLVEK